MRLVLLNAIGGLGGAERVMLDGLAALRRAMPGARPHVITAVDGPLVGRARELGAGAEVLPMPPELAAVGDAGLVAAGEGRTAALAATARSAAAALAALPGYVRRLRDRLRRLRPDIVHSHGNKLHLMAVAAASATDRRGRAVPVVWHLHDLTAPRPLMSRLLRAAVAASGFSGPSRVRCLAISRAVAADAAGVLPSTPCEVLLNAVDTDAFRPRAPGEPAAGAWLDELAGFPPSSSPSPSSTSPSPGWPILRIGLAATYARWKGHDVFLRAAAAVRPPPGTELRFLIIGGPLYKTAGSQFTRAELSALAAELGVADRVGFVGFRDEMPPVLRALDIAVHASTQPEPFGRTIAEAMACGLPTVVSAAGGAAELFTHDADAVGVAPGDVAGLAGALTRLAGDPLLRRRLGDSARLTAESRFTLDRYGRELADFYRRIAGRA